MDTEAENIDQSSSTKLKPKEPSTEVSLDDEWAAALAEQNQEETMAHAPDVQAQPLATTASQSVVTEELHSTEVSLDDEWAAALAEHSQEDASPASSETFALSSDTEVEAESTSPMPQATNPEELPSTEAALEDEWAGALAEQSQEDAVASGSEEAVELAVPTPPPTAEGGEAPSTEADLENEWAAALAEQEQTETTSDLNTSVTSDDGAEAQADISASAVPEAPALDIDNDDDMENDWADVLEEQTQSPDNPVRPELSTENENTQEEPSPTSEFTTDELQALAPELPPETEAAPMEAQHPEEGSSTNHETHSEESVTMNWPDVGTSQPTEWKPKRIGEDPEAALPLPEELLATSMASSASQEPPPELPLAAIAAQSTIEAAMETADDVAAIIQDEQAIEEQWKSATESKNLEDCPPPSETPTNPVETSAAPETQDVESAPPDPQPPAPEALIPNSEEAPDRFRRPFFSGTGGSLFGIFTMNTLLTLLTFGVYSFWGRVKIRRYLHSQTRFAGARLAFHGTGGELFKGWMKAMAIFGIPYTTLSYAGALQSNTALQWGVNIVAGLLILCFIPIAIVGSHRYRMSRTSWRGIDFSFRHSAKDFLALYLKGTLFSILSLGIYYPLFDNAKRAFLSSGTHFGNRAFGYTGEGKELGAIYFKAFRVLILGLVTAEAVLLATSFLSGKVNPNQVIDVVFWSTIGMVSMVVPFAFGVWFWFQAARQRYMWSHTTFGSARFHATMTGKDLFELKLTNLLLLLFTLGLAWPWVQTRNLQFLYYHVGLQGPLNLQQIVQDASTASPMGEELAGFFDTGFDLG